jgi:translation elongation factor aEF-1 beta
MGRVAMTYKLNPDSEVEANIDEIVETIKTFASEVYEVQSVETKPLAFGLQFVQVHVVMEDGPGLSDKFEEMMGELVGVGEIEVLSMGLL